MNDVVTETGGQPLFAADWSTTEIDGARGAGPEALRPGASWSWHGEAVRLDLGPDPARGPLRLGGALGRADLHRVAARRAARFRRRQLLPKLWASAPRALHAEDAPLRDGFCVSDGSTIWAVAVTEGRAGGGFGVPRLVLFAGEPPPRGRNLWIVDVARPGRRRQRMRPALSGLALGTLVETPHGPYPVEGLRPGDLILTDMGTVALEQVRLRPAVQALILPAGLLGTEGPARPVTLGAGTWIGVEGLSDAQAAGGEGPALPDLFTAGDGTPAALGEALVRAGDLATMPGVCVLASETLVALDLAQEPGGASVLMAGGLPCLARPVESASLRFLTRAEAQLMLAHPAARFAPGVKLRGAA